ncbi:LysR family transcriptional regulator [Pseudaminobacter soli (ex Li et al. 2025)]|uniref:LysR family transcriptional regulator n=1 Tax=Pseudaminobacter soli (ex Li et al. 2025) TaxID=1295366 RepID=A0A2P7SK40_9HYPH|nr:LysR family transcriptional regulator [Mesorhizobium soli]PSJ62862.1 LysR family transcriptional regulator [Mesorhizobium soli]
MHRAELADLTAFIAVADNLNFRAAAARLGVTPSALSHTMRQMEERLGVRLLNRTTRSVSLTDAGLRLLGRLRPAIDQISEALEDLKLERQRPFGTLRICASHPMAAMSVMAPVWERYLSMYPDVYLDISVQEGPIDIVAKGFDAGIGPQDMAALDMIAVRVMEPMRVAVVGAPKYFARRAPPQTPDDLARHSCIQFRIPSDGSVLEWPFEHEGKSQHIKVAGHLTVNDPALALRAAIDGVGIAITLEAMAAPFLRSGQMVRVLEDWSPAFEGFFLYYPGHRQIPAALRALIDMIRTTGGSAPASPLINPFVYG